jgi:hypothetical protein
VRCAGGKVPLHYAFTYALCAKKAGNNFPKIRVMKILSEELGVTKFKSEEETCPFA